MQDTGNNEKEYELQKKQTNIVVIILLSVIIAGILGFVYYKTVLPNQLMKSGKKYWEINKYEKALRIFKYVESRRPTEVEPLYYEILTLAKMTPTYAKQKRIYKVSLYDDCDEASKLAKKVISNLRKQIYSQVGSNYIDNVLFENKILRWNNSQAITYSINESPSITNEFSDMTDKAFQDWQSVMNGELKFKKTEGHANIVIHLVKNFPEYKSYSIKEPNALVIPSVEGNILNRMDIYIKGEDKNGNLYPIGKLYALLQHEIGHALGIGGHSRNVNDVMFYGGDFLTGETHPKKLTKRDYNTLNILYKMVPDAINLDLTDEVKNYLLFHPIITSFTGKNFEFETSSLMQELKTDKKNMGKWLDLASKYTLNRRYYHSNYILLNILPLFDSKEEQKFAIYYNIALNFYKLKNYKMSLEYLKKAESISSDKETKTLRAFLDVKAGNLDNAKEKLTELNKENPTDIEIALKLGEIYVKQNKKKQARILMEQLIKQNPSAFNDERVLKYKK